jgi:hypothetical protein
LLLPRLDLPRNHTKWRLAVEGSAMKRSDHLLRVTVRGTKPREAIRGGAKTLAVTWRKYGK